MKKLPLSLLIIIFSVTPVFSQFSFGFKAGLNVANAKSIGSNDNKIKPGLYAGILAEVGISKKFFVNPEILYSVKGFKFPATNVNSNGTLSLNYFSVPVMGGYKINDQINILLGPEFNFLTKANSVFDGSDHDVTHSFRKFDMAIDLGSSYIFKIGLGIEIRYSYGFKDLVDVIYADQMGNITGKGKEGSNRVLQIGVIYKFSKKQ